MNTNPTPSSEDRPEQRRAFELLLQARHGPLPSEDQAFLQSWLAEHPSDQLQADAMLSQLDDLKDAKLSASPSLISRINAASARMARESQVPALSESSEASPLRRVWWLIWGKAEPHGPRLSWNTILVGRSLAVYLGVAVVMFAYLGLSADAREARADERDRAWLESPALPPLPEDKPRMRVVRPQLNPGQPPK